MISLCMVLFLPCFAFANRKEYRKPFDYRISEGSNTDDVKNAINAAFEIMPYSVWNPDTRTKVNFSFGPGDSEMFMETISTRDI